MTASLCLNLLLGRCFQNFHYFKKEKRKSERQKRKRKRKKYIITRKQSDRIIPVARFLFSVTLWDITSIFYWNLNTVQMLQNILLSKCEICRIENDFPKIHTESCVKPFLLLKFELVSVLVSVSLRSVDGVKGTWWKHGKMTINYQCQ